MVPTQEFIEDYSEPDAFCRKHGISSVIKTGIMDGYAGSVCYYWKLECGCVLVSDVDDMLTAE
jgi:hypothetical protein